MEHIFLSHSSKDKSFVRMLAADIKASGDGIWLDEIELQVGDSLTGSISSAIREARYLIAFLSENSLNSYWVEKELELASTGGIANKCISVLPLLIGRIRLGDIPSSLKDLLFLDFRDAAQYDAAFHKLLRRVKPDFKSEKILNIDSFRADQLVEFAHDPLLRDWVVDYLIGALPGRIDPTEKYWSYIALAKINSRKAKERIQLGFVEETNEFARLGAEEGLELLKK
jgi:hypothetical protein